MSRFPASRSSSLHFHSFLPYDRSRLERDTRYAAATGDWNRDFTEREAAYKAAFQGAEAEYKPTYDTWTAQQLAGANNALLNFNRGWDRENRYWDDKYNREGREADQAWRERVYTGDAAWREYLSQVQQRQFLATLPQSL